MIPGSQRYATAIAAAKMISTASVMDLTNEDFEFVSGDQLWLISDRTRAKRCVESLVYGAIDVVGIPRFPAPAEFVAAAIALYVHPVNIQLACGMLDGLQTAEAVLQGIDDRMSAAELFVHTLRIRAGLFDLVDNAQKVGVATKRAGVAGVK